MALKFDGRSPGSNILSWTNLLHAFVRFIQILFACVVIGYYASDLNAARKVNKYADSKWVYAVAVGSMAAISALILGALGFFMHFTTLAITFGWDWLMFIFWVILTGIFGKMYFGENAEMDNGIKEMKTAAIFDIINMLLWFITAVVGTVLFFRGGRKSLHTGRATL